jgi:hypothetical protein
VALCQPRGGRTSCNSDCVTHQSVDWSNYRCSPDVTTHGPLLCSLWTHCMASRSPPCLLSTLAAAIAIPLQYIPLTRESTCASERACQRCLRGERSRNAKGDVAALLSDLLHCATLNHPLILVSESNCTVLQRGAIALSSQNSFFAARDELYC